MKLTRTLLASSAIAMFAVPALAQEEVTTGANATGITVIHQQITDIEDAVQDDFARSNDSFRYGPRKMADGVRGGVSLTYNGRSGNVDNKDFALGGRLSHKQGPFAQSSGVAISYAEDDAGDPTEKKVSAIYDAQYYFNDRFYAFALGRATVDGMVDDDLDAHTAGTLSPEKAASLEGRVKRDAFLGFGPGYRVIDTSDMTWRVQAGVGLRHTQTVDFTEADNLDSETETGYIASSRFYKSFGDRTFLTNDTDYIKSDANETAWNELAVNYKFSNNLTGRTSYQTEYVSDRPIRTDNKVGVSMVFGF